MPAVPEASALETLGNTGIRWDVPSSLSEYRAYDLDSFYPACSSITYALIQLNQLER